MDPVFAPGRFYTKAQAREPLGLSERGFEVWAAREKLTVYHLSGRLVRYSGAELAAAIERAARRKGLPATGACSRAPS